MNSSDIKTPEINSKLIDQLVSGDLRGQAYRQAIQALESNPHRWRDCALAFLQEQAIEQELKQLALTSTDWSNMTSKEKNDVSSVQYARELPVGTLELQHNSTMRIMVRIASLAALALLSFGIGMMIAPKGPHWASDNLGGQIVSNSVPANTDAHDGHFVQDNPTNRLPNQNILASNGSNGQGRMVDLETDHNIFRNTPPWIGNLSSQLLPIDQEIPADLREMERQGRIRIESSSALMPIQHNDGTSVLVPVQQLQIVPVVYTY